MRCLAIAVHPNTADEEVIAAINGFRRTAAGIPLGQVCREFAGLEAASQPGMVGAGEWREALDRLARENFELRLKIEQVDDNRVATQQRLAEAEQRNREISEELAATAQRADTAEQHLATFRGAHSRISSALQSENSDLQHALDEARRNLAQPIHEPVLPFQRVLNAALGRSVSTPAATPAAVSAHPWTA
jgi:septal ring factor EnvC (AmiA/AmiB activator)